MAEYASNAKGNAALTTGIIGTSLGAISAAGGLGAILGLGPRQPTDPGDKPITRYEMGLMNENRDLRDEITALKAASYTDRRAGELQREIDGQGAVNATMIATLQNQQGQINQLFGITKLVVPNDNVSPGWGRAAVQAAPAPGPAFAVYPWPWFGAPFQAPPAQTPTSGTASTSGATTGG